MGGVGGVMGTVSAVVFRRPYGINRRLLFLRPPVWRKRQPHTHEGRQGGVWGVYLRRKLLLPTVAIHPYVQTLYVRTTNSTAYGCCAPQGTPAVPRYAPPPLPTPSRPHWGAAGICDLAARTSPAPLASPHYQRKRIQQDCCAVWVPDSARPQLRQSQTYYAPDTRPRRETRLGAPHALPQRGVCGCPMCVCGATAALVGSPLRACVTN